MTNMTNMAAMLMYGKNLKNLLLQNQVTDCLETWGVALNMQVLQKYLYYDLDPFMPMLNLATIVIVWEKENFFLLSLLKHSTK